MNNPRNCRVPMAIADALTSIAMYDVSAHPIRITAVLPDDSYWSLSCYATSTANFFVINHRELRAARLSRANVVLKHQRHGYEPVGDEVVVTAPSTRGVILMRWIVPDPAGSGTVARLVDVQAQAKLEPVQALGSCRSAS